MESVIFRTPLHGLLLLLVTAPFIWPLLGAAKLDRVVCDDAICHVAEYSAWGRQRTDVRRPITTNSPLLSDRVAQLSAPRASTWWIEGESAGLVGLVLLIVVAKIASRPLLGMRVRLDRASATVYIERNRLFDHFIEETVALRDVRRVDILSQRKNKSPSFQAKGQSGPSLYSVNLQLADHWVRLLGGFGTSAAKAERLAARLEKMLGLPSQRRR